MDSDEYRRLYESKLYELDFGTPSPFNEWRGEIYFKDAKDEFIDYMKSRATWDADRTVSPYIFQELAQHESLKCIKALLEGETVWSLEVNMPLPCGTYALHEAARFLNLDLIELLLFHGAQADLRTIGSDTVRSGLLPLNVSLEVLGNHIFLQDWTPEQSIFKLVILLCVPQMKIPLEVNRLLAKRTKETHAVLYNYLKDGKLIEMAVLLMMVARENVMDPTEDKSKCGNALNISMAIRRWIEVEIASLEFKLAGEGENAELDAKKIMVLRSSLLLLEVFDKAGAAIEAYIQSEQSNVANDKVVEDVQSLLVNAGFALKDEDIDFSDIDRPSITDFDPTLEEPKNTWGSGVGSHDYYDCMSFRSAQWRSPLVKDYFFQRYFTYDKPVLHKTRGNGFGCLYHTLRNSNTSSVFEFQTDSLKGSTNALKQCPRHPHSSLRFASFALAIKRGIRLV